MKNKSDVFATFWRNNAYRTHIGRLRTFLWEEKCNAIAEEIKRRKKAEGAYERSAAAYYAKHGTVGEF